MFTDKWYLNTPVLGIYFKKRRGFGVYCDTIYCWVTQPLKQSPYNKAHQESNRAIKIAAGGKSLQSIN